MARLFTRWCVSLLFVCSAVASEDVWTGAVDATLHGTLIKRYFTAPKIVAGPPFGWFVELNEASRRVILDCFAHIPESDKSLYASLDLRYVRLLTHAFSVREWAQDHADTEITVNGEILVPRLLGDQLRAFDFCLEEGSLEITKEETERASRRWDKMSWEPSSFDWENAEDDQSLVLLDDQPEHLVSLTGFLHLEILNRDHECGDVEDGGEPAYCWMVKLDPQSFDIACSIPVRAAFQTPASIRACKKGNEMWLTGDFDEDWLSCHINQTVTVQGYLWHAHTAHHHTLLMLDTDPWFK